MPIYEYKCENGHVFDVMQRMSEDPLTECRVCGASVRKVMQPVGISFKGSGFYSTDYSRSAPKTDSKETTKAESSTNGSSEKNGSSGSSEKKSDASSSTAKAKSGD